MTPRQIWAIYQHPRDKEGNVKLPEPKRVEPQTVGEAVSKFRGMAQLLGISEADRVKGEERIRERYAGQS